MLAPLLDSLTAKARLSGFTDAEWARRAGLRKETLSRLRRRDDCDLRTLQALAVAVGTTLALADDPSIAEPFPPAISRQDEARLLALASHLPDTVDTWRSAGPPGFLAGLAVMLASERGPERCRWLDLAEQLEPGASQPEAFARWLQRSPLRPSRFLPMLEAERRRAG